MPVSAQNTTGFLDSVQNRGIPQNGNPIFMEILYKRIFISKTPDANNL